MRKAKARSNIGIHARARSRRCVMPGVRRTSSVLWLPMIKAPKSPRTTQQEGQYGQSGGGEGVSRAIERRMVTLCAVQQR